MKKIKSILAFLMFGSLTLSGCSFLDLFKSKKNNSDTPADTGGGDHGGGGEVEVKYVIYFNANYGSATSEKAGETSDGSIVLPLSQFDREGYTFTGWNTEADGSGTSYVNGATITGITADLTLYAQWSENVPPVDIFTVTFDLQGHGEDIADVEVAGGSLLAKPTDPTAEGFEFDGWFKESGCLTEWDFETDTVTSDLTLYAKWVEQETPPVTESYTVTFVMNGHGEAVASQTIDEGGKVAKPADPEAEGYTFDGWFDEGLENEWDFDNDTVTSNVTLYAKWTENAEDLVSVTFNLQGHGDNWYVCVKPGETVSKPSTDPEDEGYIFGGWYKEEACETAWDFATMTISVDTVIYAKWTAVPTPSTATIKVTHGTTTTAHNLSKDSEEATEYSVKNLKIESGDTIEIEINSTKYGYDLFKSGGESSKFELADEKIRCIETHDYDIYVETDTAKADGEGNLVYIDCEDYIKYSVPSQGENVWATKKVSLKAESTSEYEIEIALEKGAKFMFNVHDVVDEQPGRHYYKTIKDGGVKTWIDTTGSDPVILVGGTYHLYCQTPASEVEVGVYATAIHSAETNYVEVKSGSADSVKTTLALKVEDEVTSIDEFKTELALLEGDKVRFFVNGEWIDEFKEDAPAKDKFEAAGEDHYFEVKEGYAGDFVFYSKFLGENQGIWVLGGGELLTSVILTVNGTPHALAQKGDTTEYFIKGLEIQADDEITITVDEVTYGIDKFKAGGASDKFELKTEKITCNETHEFDIYVETDADKADGEGKLVYIDCEDYIKYSVPSAGENVWETAKVSHKVDIVEEEPVESQFEYEIEIALEKGAKFMFNVHDNTGRNYYKTIKEGGASLWIDAPEEGDPSVKVGGTYHMYCQTPEELKATGIYVLAEPDGATNYVEVLANGESTPVKTPLNLKEELGDTYYDEFFRRLELEAGDKVRFVVNGQALNALKTGSDSADANFNAADVNNYFEVKTGKGGTYDFYLAIFGEGARIWVQEYHEPTPVNHQIVFDQNWVCSDDALIYAWVWGEGIAGHWELLDIKTVADVDYADVTWLSTVSGFKIYRFNKTSEHLPTVNDPAAEGPEAFTKDVEYWNCSAENVNVSADIEVIHVSIV